MILILIRKLKIDFFLAVVLFALIQTFNTQNKYPNIVSGLGAFRTSKNVPSTFNTTYTNPFEFGKTLTCVHTINGFEFQTTNLATQTFFIFDTSLNTCTNTMIGLYALVSDNYLSSIKFYYLVISNNQQQTEVMFQVVPIINGQTNGLIRDKNTDPKQAQKYLRQSLIRKQKSMNGQKMSENSKEIVAYPCLSSLNIGTSDHWMSFQIQSKIFSDTYKETSILQTSIRVYYSTYITSITIKALTFNIVQSTAQNDYITYWAYAGYMSKPYQSKIIDRNVNITHFDEDYFFVFVGFRWLSLDFTNIQMRTINGQTSKYLWMQYDNPSTLKFKTNFMQDYESFFNSHANYYYLVITKYKQISKYNKNIQSLQENESVVLLNIIAISIGIVLIILCKKIKCNFGKISKSISRKPANELVQVQGSQNIQLQA